MKKILGAVFIAMVLGIFAGCASKPTGDARDTSAYQQAGNSIVVDVLIALLKQMDITQYGV